MTKREKIQQFLIRNKACGLLAFRPEELVILCGYYPYWNLSVLLYPLDGTPILYIPELEPEIFIPQGLHVKSYPWGTHITKKAACPPFDVLLKLLKEDVSKVTGTAKAPLLISANLGQGAPGRIWAEAPAWPDDFVSRIIQLHPFIKTSDSILQLYRHKSEEDIAGLRLTHRVGEKAIQSFYQNLHIGKSEASLAGDVEASVQETIGKDGVVYAKAQVFIQSGMNAAYGGRHNYSSGKLIQKHDTVLLEMALCVNGYWADISRTGAPEGQTTDNLLQIYNIIYKAGQAAIHALAPGLRFSEIDKISRTIITEAGYGDLFNHATGHPTGFRYHDPGPAIAPYSEDYCEEGMVLTIEPGIYSKELGGGCRIEENVLIRDGTNAGFEVLSYYPRSLGGKHE